jgi:predicted Kef-type K+ transport protein
MENFMAVESLSVSLAVAFIFGMGARMLSMPPMLGFLLAGFALSLLGVEETEAGRQIADFGVLLLLFTIGLKLRLRSLVEPHVLGVAAGHMLVTVVGCAGLLLAFAALGVGLFAGLDLAQASIIAFALSFSSTVFTVKVFEERGAMGSVQGRTAIGILILQDIAAVVFLTLASAGWPSPWALALVGLLALPRLFGLLLDRMGHDELLPLFGLVAALVLGAALFKAVGLKPDLGALVMGIIMGSHRRSAEVAESLFSFKEIFLIGFFLNIGLRGIPSMEVILTAAALMGVLVLKLGLFFALLCAFRLRARTALLAALGLATYSEFALIVGSVAVDQALIPDVWLSALALAVALSFLLLTPANAQADGLYDRFHGVLRRFEAPRRVLTDQDEGIGRNQILIFGMGRLGSAVYRTLEERFGPVLLGVETDREKVDRLVAEGLRVIHADATDPDFWRRAGRPGVHLRAVLLAMPDHSANIYALERIREAEYEGFVAAMARYPEESALLTAAGSDIAFDVYGQAGTGFAAEIAALLDSGTDPRKATGATA